VARDRARRHGKPAIVNKNAPWSAYCCRADSPFASLRERFMRSKLEAIAGPMKGAKLYLTDYH
jgi:hypothetical protein